MKQDFRTTRGKTTFSLRASALIVRDDKIFLTRDATGKYYTIGGASLVGEKTRETVLRETLEEIGIFIEVEQLAFVVENRFYINDVFWHNIEFHYLVRPLEEPKLEMMENTKQQVCEWVPIHELDQINLVPEFLQTELAKWPGHIVHIEG
ncbi:NUDIX domain-containing protein [Streptococcus canis]|uniref:NUDIX hydrolase n=1 Tax=Streptococcus canis TaxID=1329 RepID=UPI002996ECA7|nr:NUDIX domain-containing protein [Streptococcus canis]